MFGTANSSTDYRDFLTGTFTRGGWCQTCGILIKYYDNYDNF
jgi:hypothetical protein